jgi:hypothetical protein
VEGEADFHQAALATGTARHNLVAGKDANTNPQAPIASDLAATEAAKEHPVANMGNNYTSPQRAGGAIVAAAGSNACTKADTTRETNRIEAYSGDAASTCSTKDFTAPIPPTPVDIHAPQENTTREEIDRIGEAEKDRKKTETPPKSSETKNYSHTELPRNSLHQPMMRTQRQFKTNNPTGDII